MTRRLADDPLLHDLVQVLSGKLPDLGAEAITDLAQVVYAELELRVGTRLAEGLSDSQLHDFEVLSDTGDEHGMARWLDTTVPHHRQLVRAIRTELIDETVEAVDRHT
ncbi:DUF5663 domain-containing protein [Rhodococcus ruber]|uniref:DUF5663 domain-containing protein n=1 Tax=Rhodococcus ruber TaxID=1830 RepID=UPI000C7A9036|nr:DUF5663 domain-containing protein [Rhodococcus ruber]AUM20236.1 hypothetical protein CSW53_27075 [Rhodococcus ruber]